MNASRTHATIMAHVSMAPMVTRVCACQGFRGLSAKWIYLFVMLLTRTGAKMGASVLKDLAWTSNVSALKVRKHSPWRNRIKHRTISLWPDQHGWFYFDFTLKSRVVEQMEHIIVFVKFPFLFPI